MFAIVAAVLFGLALLFEIINERMGDLITPRTLALAGLLLLAIHLAPPWGSRWRGRRR